MLAAVSIPARAQDFQWIRQFGSTGDDYGKEVAVDGSGNVVVTGFFGGTVDFGGGGLTSAGGDDIFVAKYSGADGSHLWSKRFGSILSDQGVGVAVDGNGNVVLIGVFDGTVDFGGGGLTSAGNWDIFVAKYSGADGSHLWSKRFGNTSNDVGVGVAVDGNGNAVVTGYFEGTVDFGGGGLTSAGLSDIFLAKYSGADGSHLWSKRFGSTSADGGLGVAVDSSGNLVVTGSFRGTVNFGGGGLTSAGLADIFVAKYSAADGSHLWSKRFGSTSNDFGRTVAVDSSGNVVLTGTFRDTVNFGGGGLTSAGSDDIFLAKYSGADGSHLWSKRFGSTSYEEAYSLAVDGSGNVVVTGYFNGTVDFGGGGLTSAGGLDIFVAKYSGADGSHLWSKRLGSTSFDYGYGVAVDSSGNLVVTGSFRDTVDFGGGGLTSAGGHDAFASKLDGGGSTSYYLPHLALGGGWQTTITYVNYSPQTVACTTTFYSDSGGPLLVPFGSAAASSRTDTLAPGGIIHEESKADLNAPEVRGWARAQCSGPIKASLLFRSYQQGKPTGEAGVNAMTAAATKFVTFAAKQAGGVATGVAYANPSTQTAQITFNALSSTGAKLASKSLSLLAGEHGASLLDSLLGLSSFTGSIEIISTVPIISLSLNFEAFPTFSSLPPGELDGSTASYFPHLALGGGWQTTLTYINPSSSTVTCTTTFFSDSGGPLSVSFGGAAASSRTDTLAPGGIIHDESKADLSAPEVRGWAKAQCSGPIKANLLFRSYQGGVATGEAGVNAMTAPTTKFVTFSDQTTGVAYANPSTQSAEITFTAINSAGAKLASKSLPLLPGEHGAANLGPLLGLSSFTGSIQIVSTVPIVSLSLNAEAFPAFSSLPPGELDDATPLATGGQ